MIFRVLNRRGTIKDFDTIKGPGQKAPEAAAPVRVPEPPKPIKKAKKKQEKRVKKERKFLGYVLGGVKVVLFVLSFSTLLFSGAVYAYQSNYKARALFGTKVLGEDVGGKTEEEIKKVLSDKVSGISFSFTIDGEEIRATPADAGVTFEIEKSAKNAVEKGKKDKTVENLSYLASSLVYKVSPTAAEKTSKKIKDNLELSYAIDEIKLSAFTKTLSERFNSDSKDAGLVMKGAEVDVIPAIYGRKIVTDSVKSQITSALRKTKGGSIKVDVEKVNPSLLEEDTKESIDAAKSLISKEVVFSYEGKKFMPDKATIGGWITFKEVTQGEKKRLVPEVDSKLVYPYINGLAAKINIAPVNKKITVINGGEQKVDNEGQDGLSVDVSAAAANTARVLTSGKPVSMELPTYAVKFKTTVNNVVVADWAKYLTVDISEQRACAYLAGGELVNCWAVTTGKSGLGTPLGTHIISRKAGAGGAPGEGGGGVCMPNPPSRYPLCGINFVSYFTSAGHAFHEAWWRSSFGGPDYVYNGSHGCVNVPYSVAEFIYWWAPIGTPVIIQQ